MTVASTVNSISVDIATGVPVLAAGTILLQKLRSDGAKATPPDDTAKSAQ